MTTNTSESKYGKIRWISLQPLVGGMVLGAENAFGCKPVCNIDFEGPDKGNSSAYMYYQNEVKNANLKHLILNGGILSMSTEFKDPADEEWFVKNCQNIDVVSAVPICSGLSAANAVNDSSKATKRGADAQQNNNMYGIAKMTFERIKPKVFIFENAPALFTNCGKPVRDKIMEMGTANGYCVTWVKTNTNKHGNPQYRSRTFGIFWKDTQTPQLKYVNKPHASIIEYLSAIDPKAEYNTLEYANNTKVGESGWYKYAKAKFGDNWRDCIAGKLGFWAPFLSEFSKTGKYDFSELKPYLNEKELKMVEHIEYKLSIHKGFMDCSTPVYKGPNDIPTVFHRHIQTLVHPTELRGYTLRELMKFMGMPDDFVWPNAKKTHIWVSQNVPVVTSQDWHAQIREYLEGKLPGTGEKETYFNNEKGEPEKSLLEDMLNNG